MEELFKPADQKAPFPEILDTLVNKLKYKPGWVFDLGRIDRGQGSEGLTLAIYIDCVDTYNPDRRIRIVHYMPVPPAAYNEVSWKRWLLEQILLVERHEACEFFQIDGSRPYAPHHGPGFDPYQIFEHGELQDARTNFLGQKRDTDAPRPGEF
ncbi:MAG TPA: hypothetical protein VHA37_01835 [Candidatus Saccharimonadales bacterium]|nr:hypothetical protein [Candidatus Saccharimonadales bacterium]